MIALAQTVTAKPSAIQEQCLAGLMVTFLSPHPNTSVVLSKVWQLRQPLVLKGMVDWYNSEPDAARLARVLDVAQDIKALPTLLNCTDVGFVLRLAMLAARREFLNLERWLQDRMRDSPTNFCRMLVQFLQNQGESSPSAGGGGTAENMRVLLDVLTAAVPTCAPELVGVVHRLRDLPAFAVLPSNPQPDVFNPAAFPSLQQPHPQHIQPAMGLLPDSHIGTEPAALMSREGVEQVFAKEIEDEANAHFQKIYQNLMSIEEFVSMLLSFKASPSPKQRDVFACMVRMC